MFVYITASKVNKFRYIEFSTGFYTLSTYGGHASICYKKSQKRDKNRVKSGILSIFWAKSLQNQEKLYI